jgi:hypothetical protein
MGRIGSLEIQIPGFRRDQKDLSAEMVRLDRCMDGIGRRG